MKTFDEFKKQFEEEITNSTSGVSGAGDNPDRTVVMRKKHDRKNKRKDAVEILRRLLPKKP